ncbi:hypothetical protein GCM10027562_33760 [Arthrobacter pigmenti]
MTGRSTPHSAPSPNIETETGNRYWPGEPHLSPTGIYMRTFGSQPGDAPNLVLLHGFTSSGAGWTDALRRWTPRFRIVAPDARGHGRSQRFTDQELTEPDFAVMTRDAAKVIQDLADNSPQQPLVVVGHSMGARVALHATEDHADRVSALVLEDPVWHLDYPSQPIKRYEAIVGEQVSATSVEHEFQRLREQHPSLPPEQLWEASLAGSQTDPGLAARVAAPERDWRTSLNMLDVPTLLLASDGGSVDNKQLAAVNRLNPTIQTTIIPNAGHSIRADNPDAYYRAVETFIERQLN